MLNDIAYHLRYGYVHITPEYAIWGHPVVRDKGIPELQKDMRDPDAWYVRFAIGKNWLQHFFSLMPYQLPYVGWARWEKKMPVKYFKTENLKRKISYGI